MKDNQSSTSLSQRFVGVLLACAAMVMAAVTVAGAKDVAILVSADAPPYQQAVQGILSHIAAPIETATYNMNGDLLEGRELGKRLRGANPDVVVAVGLKATLVAKLEIMDAPVVFCLVLNPQLYDLPADNMAGIQLRVPIDDQVRTMRSMRPNMRRIGMLYDPKQSERFVLSARTVAHTMGIDIVSTEVTHAADLPHALRQLLPRVDILWLFRDATVVTEESIPFLLETALDYRTPVFGYSSGLTQHGAAASMSVDYTDMGRQAGELAKHILANDGMSPTEARLHPPRQPRLALNLGVSRHLSLTTDPLLQTATAIFGGSSAVAQRDTASPDSSDDEHLDDSLLIQ